jgi:hypothetical protein
MASPKRPGAATNFGGAELPPFEPIDTEEIRHRELLREASLVSFTATPNMLVPFGRATLAWSIAMPTTIIPGVHVVAHLWGPGFDHVIDPSGSVIVLPYVDATYSVYLRTPLVARELGVLELGVNMGTCTSVEYAASVFSGLVVGEANKPFPAGGEVTLRGSGSSVDIGYNSFVVDVPLEIEVPHWFNADIDVSMGFNVFSQDGQIRATFSVARVTVSFGTASVVLSAGCSAAVAAALEMQAHGFLDGFVGPVIAERIAVILNREMTRHLNRLNGTPAPIVPHPLLRSYPYGRRAQLSLLS